MDVSCHAIGTLKIKFLTWKTLIINIILILLQTPGHNSQENNAYAPMELLQIVGYVIIAAIKVNVELETWKRDY